MSKYEVITILISLFAILISIIDLLWSRSLSKKQNLLDQKSYDLNDKALKIQEGQIELEMASQLSSAKRYVDSWESMLYETKSEEEKKILLKQKQQFVIEEALNCYENLCQKYLDDKTDKERFKKTYYKEIINLYSKNKIFKEKLDGQSSPYKAIKKVYDEWENLE